MIRSAKPSDIESLLTVWLNASILAHNFMPASYWASKIADMRDVYLPVSENCVYEKDGVVIGFASIYQSSLSALFVSPSQQGKGIGSKLINYIKSKHRSLDLSVYKENKASIAFYQQHGFTCVGEQLDEHTGHPEVLMKLNT